MVKSAVFGKAMEDLRKQRDIKLVTTVAKMNYLVSEWNYHATRNFSDNLLTIEMKRTQMLMNKSFYLGLSILEISKIAIDEFWCKYVKPKYL